MISNITVIRNGGNMSRHEVVDWVNQRVKGRADIVKVEDLCTGVAYCCLMDMLSPKCINMSLVEMTPAGKEDYERNLQLLQTAFNQLKFKTKVPIDLIIQGRFKHNFEFFQYFKKVFDLMQTRARVEAYLKAKKAEESKAGPGKQKGDNPVKFY